MKKTEYTFVIGSKPVWKWWENKKTRWCILGWSLAIAAVFVAVSVWAPLADASQFGRWQDAPKHSTTHGFFLFQQPQARPPAVKQSKSDCPDGVCPADTRGQEPAGLLNPSPYNCPTGRCPHRGNPDLTPRYTAPQFGFDPRHEPPKFDFPSLIPHITPIPQLSAILPKPEPKIEPVAIKEPEEDSNTTLLLALSAGAVGLIGGYLRMREADEEDKEKDAPPPAD